MADVLGAGPTLAEETEQRLRLRIVHLESLVEQQTENAIRWRQAFEQAERYLAVLHPPLAEIAADDMFRLWQMDVA